MTASWQLIVGLLAVFFLGFSVRPLVECVQKTIPLPPPNGVTEDKWKELTGGNEAGKILGNLERILFFGALWIDTPSVIAAWLAFKVASKWDAWKNVISVPQSLPEINDLEYLIARCCWGSQQLSTFLVGTLTNIIIGLLGLAIGRHGCEFVRSLFC